MLPKMTERSLIRGKGRSCCVPQCPNKEQINRDINFYCFPNRAWEIDRKKIWIARVRRAPIGKRPWEPKKETRICSAHFVGGERSQDPRKESFNPSIFPWNPQKELLVTRAKRLVNLKKRKLSHHSINDNSKNENVPSTSNIQQKQKIKKTLKASSILKNEKVKSGILKKRLKIIEPREIGNDFLVIRDDPKVLSKLEFNSGRMIDLIKTTTSSIKQLSGKLEEVETFGNEELQFKEKTHLDEHLVNEFHAGFTEIANLVKYLKERNNMKILPWPHTIIEVDNLKRDNIRLKKEVSRLKLRLYDLQLQIKKSPNGQIPINVTQQTVSPSIVYIID